MLPLHLALLIPNIPLAIVKALIKVFPEGEVRRFGASVFDRFTVVCATPAVAEPFVEPVHKGIQGYLPLTFMYTHQACLRWASLPDPVLRRDACVGAEYKTTSAWLCESEVASVMSFKDLVYARSNGGDPTDVNALSDAAGEYAALDVSSAGFRSSSPRVFMDDSRDGDDGQRGNGSSGPVWRSAGCTKTLDVFSVPRSPGLVVGHRNRLQTRV
jgi:hypothetical protein